MSSSRGTTRTDPPPADERLVAAESRYEVEDGKVVYVAPADEPHASRHSKLSALLEAHVAEGYDVASDMLTRSSEHDDFAPDASVFPSARDPATGRRQLEELSFEVLSTERLGHAGRKAEKLVARGVRRVFAVDTERGRAFEWSRELASWAMLSDGGQIADAALAVALPVEALVHAAKVDDAVARALLAKGNPVLTQALEMHAAQGKAEGRAEGKAEGRAEGKAEGRAEGKAEVMVRLLALRFGPLPTAAEARVRAASADELDRLAERFVNAQRLEDIFGTG